MHLWLCIASYQNGPQLDQNIFVTMLQCHQILDLSMQVCMVIIVLVLVLIGHCYLPIFRVTKGDKSKEGHGKIMFIRREELEFDPDRKVQYLKDDTLVIRVVDVTVA